ncbi:MAG: cyclic nucleotide-binding protein [Gammaproteobacteria bacterium]|nr:cyclic nucleotide-binding protein [Gammaproteobacteria bacterium]
MKFGDKRINKRDEVDTVLLQGEALLAETATRFGTETPLYHRYSVLLQQYRKLNDDLKRLTRIGDLRDAGMREAEAKIKQQKAALEVAHTQLNNYAESLEKGIEARTRDLLVAQQALRAAMDNLRLIEITTGVYWLQVPEVRLYILCGSPAEVVKHLMRRGQIVTTRVGDVVFETGPNAILLSDVPLQNGYFSNLAEFPILQMLYRQGMMIPNHPNNSGVKPLLIGHPSQIKAQLEYIHRGNYGLLSVEELLEAGVEPVLANLMMRVKRRFAFGNIQDPAKIIDTVAVPDSGNAVEISHGVTVRRVALNRFEFAFRDETQIVDLNLPPDVTYQSPYTLDYHEIPREYFSILHSGEGDGWDFKHPSMSSVIMYQGEVYLVDAPPNITDTLEMLGIDMSEVVGLFHTHVHDDHFAGLTTLMLCDHKIKYFATPMVRFSAEKKLAALLGESGLHLVDFFEIHDLQLDEWNDINQMGVKPLYSPHPVENNIFVFRVRDTNGFRTYAHWADLTSFALLDKMVGSGPDDLPRDFIERIKSNYLHPADLKKLDIGGGMIHGVAEDFKFDASNRISLAHIDRPLSNSEKEIGSAAPFGSIDTQIPATRDYLRKRAIYTLQSIFNNISYHRLESLLNAPITYVNPGIIIRKQGLEDGFMSLLLTGSVEYVNAEKGIRSSLASGSLVGEQSIFSRKPLDGTWRAISHVSLMRFSIPVLRSFLEENDLLDPFYQLVQHIEFLRETWLFGQNLSYATLSNIANAMQLQHYCSGESVIIDDQGQDNESLYLIRAGEVEVIGQRHVRLGRGKFICGEWIFGRCRSTDTVCRTIGEAEIYRIERRLLRDIPVINWKLIEIASKWCRSNTYTRYP